MASMIDLRSKFLGGMTGSALGDSIGEIVLYKARRGSISGDELYHSIGESDLRKLIDEFEELRYTDDTAMSIGLAESIIATHSIDQQHLGDRFRLNMDREPWRGYGNGPPAVFLMVEKKKITYEEASKRVGAVMFGGQGSFGNGAAMRITPVGLFFYDAPDIYSLARASALVTHTHPIAIDGAVVLAKAIGDVVKSDPAKPFRRKRFCKNLIDFARTSEIREKMELVFQLVSQNVSPQQAAERLGRSVATHESMPFALYSFVRHPSSFEECLFCAVTNGGDCDTLGAMACGISGAFLGIDAIPHNWRLWLENRKYIAQLADWLWAAKTHSKEIDDKELKARLETWTTEIRHMDDEFLEEL